MMTMLDIFKERGSWSYHIPPRVEALDDTLNAALDSLLEDAASNGLGLFISSEAVALDAAALSSLVLTFHGARIRRVSGGFEYRDSSSGLVTRLSMTLISHLVGAGAASPRKIWLTVHDVFPG